MRRPLVPIIASALLVSAIFVLVSTVFLPALLADVGGRDRPTVAAESPVRWEYKTASLRFELQGREVPIKGEGRYRQIEDQLNKLGREGWLLIHAAGDFFVFRRPLRPVAVER